MSDTAALEHSVVSGKETLVPHQEMLIDSAKMDVL